MKTMKRCLALLLVAAMLAGFAVTAAAAEADAITYVEAVELLSKLTVNGQSVLEPLGGAGLGGKAQQELTKSEAVALINALGLEGRTWDATDDTAPITGKEFFKLVDRLLCTETILNSNLEKKANLNHYLIGLGDYETVSSKNLTREEACQVLLNAMDAVVQYGDTWYLRDEFGLVREYSDSDAQTDEWKRPVGRWLKDGKAITSWRTLTPVYEGETEITTHELLETIGYYEDFNNQWLNFHCYSNAGQRWDCGKLHWNHSQRSGCHKNWVSYRVGAKMEVYYLGIGVENIPDAGGDVQCQMYHVVLIDDYLAKIENQTIQIYSNENGAIWSWHSSDFPREDGYYTIRINLKAGNDRAKAIVLCPAETERSEVKSLQLNYSDGYSYAITERGRARLSTKFQLGYELLSDKNAGRLTFFYDTWGRIVGASADGFLDVTENDWFCEAVRFVDEKGLMGGTSAMKFSPYATTTRAMVWTILARMDKVDTTGEVWYEAGQSWAIENGVSDGSDPDGSITREQMAAMLWRNAGSPKAEAALEEFTDAASVSDWALDAMCWAVAEGIIKGSDGKLNPQGSASRAEVAAMLTRY